VCDYGIKINGGYYVGTGEVRNDWGKCLNKSIKNCEEKDLKEDTHSLFRKREHTAASCKEKLNSMNKTFILPVFFKTNRRARCKIWGDGRYITPDIDKIITVRSRSFVRIGGGRSPAFLKI
jgi:hypothetical protein